VALLFEGRRETEREKRGRKFRDGKKGGVGLPHSWEKKKGTNIAKRSDDYWEL